jgi:hypothetical protein
LKNILRLVLALAVGAFAVWLWLALFPSPEKVIARQFEKLARAASVRPGEGYLPRLIGAQTAAGYCATNVEISVDLPGLRQQTTISRDDIVQAMLTPRLAGGLTVKFPDITVTVGPDKETAEADITLEARAPGEQDMLAQAMKCTLRKIGGKWLITRVQTVRTFSLKRPDFTKEA